MSYLPNIPTANQFQSQSQSQIQANFMSLAPFQEGIANFPTVTPPVVTGTNLDIFNAPSTYLPATQALFIGKTSGNYEFTSYGYTSFIGWTILPSGLIVKYGIATGLTLGANTLTYPIGATIPAFTTTVMNVQLTPTAASLVDPNGIVYYAPSGTPLTTFNILVTRRNVSNPVGIPFSCQWMAIGI